MSNSSLSKKFSKNLSLFSSYIKFPTPENLTIWWNLGSLLGFCLVLQIFTGFFLALHYSRHIDFAFTRVIHTTQDVHHGWVLRNLHTNGASIYFLCLYLHALRGLFYKSYKLIYTWSLGVSILLIRIGTAFLGYVLPWGQMSLWGATVITNLLSSLPYVGSILVLWLWGGNAVEGPTLSRFFALHFLFPFMIAALVLIHLMYLHQSGSNNSLGLNRKQTIIPFHPFYSLKDILGILVVIWLLLLLTFLHPYFLRDPENFKIANSIVSPIHIKPEWYYLFAYAMLRSVPNKLGGVIVLVLSILILYLVPFLFTRTQLDSFTDPLLQFGFWRLLATILLLTWIGARRVEAPYLLTGQLLSSLYFRYFVFSSLYLNIKSSNLPVQPKLRMYYFLTVKLPLKKQLRNLDWKLQLASTLYLRIKVQKAKALYFLTEQILSSLYSSMKDLGPVFQR